jgi:hypothetical protein
MPSEDGSKPGDAPEAAQYIASFAEELARLAKSHELDALAYILDMARLEADQVAKRGARQGRTDRQRPFTALSG